MNNYIINENTLMLIPQEFNTSLIIEKDNENIIANKCLNIVDYSCRFYGSSFNGRLAGTKFLTNFKYKCPIVISEKKEIIMFPTHSFKDNSCIWINPLAIKFTKGNDFSVEILLKNNKKYLLNTSEFVINNQILKSSYLFSILSVESI